MSSIVQIWNLALIRAGSTDLVAAENEGSKSALLCGAIYEQVRDAVLRDFPWRFAKRRIALAIKEGTPPACWGFQYAVPSDCLMARSIVVPGSRVPLTANKATFEIAADIDGSAVIYTDTEEAELVYTAKVTDTNRFDPSFISALAFALGAELCVPLRGKADLSQILLNLYTKTIHQAAANSLNEGHEATPDCSLLQARNG